LGYREGKVVRTPYRWRGGQKWDSVKGTVVIVKMHLIWDRPYQPPVAEKDRPGSGIGPG